MMLNIWDANKHRYKTIAQASPTKANQLFYELLKETKQGIHIIQQLMINHELAIMDFNDALNKLNSKDP